LAQMCEYEADHSHHVARLALRVFDELRPLHKLGQRERFWLHCAAILHDIGWIEGWKSHHKVSMRIILSTPMLPFDSTERLVIGSAARYHRRALPDMKHDNIAALGPDERRIALVLAACLRFADGLDQTHQSRVRDVSCKITAKKITFYCNLRIPAPDEALSAAKKSDLLAQIFERKIVVDCE
jgi:exopolyphosphatase/pppGpp-phosphohydrolase